MLACLYVGILLGLLYDLTRPLCSFRPRLFTAAADALFWCLACLVVLHALYAINGLALRLFLPVFFSLGFLLYRASFSPLLRWLGRNARRILIVVGSAFLNMLS